MTNYIILEDKLLLVTLDAIKFFTI